MENLQFAAVASSVPPILLDAYWLGVINLSPFLVAVGLFIGLSLLFKLVQVIIVGRLQALSRRTSTDIDDVVVDAIGGIRAWVYTLVALYAALSLFTLPGWLDTAFSMVVYAAVIWQAIEIALRFIKYGTTRLVEKDEDGDGLVDPSAATASDLINLMARIVLWVFGTIFILSNLGIEVTSLIAGLGIGGIAVAFALQGILSDLFASFSIYFDKPFRIGDFIIIGTDMGTVEKIGIKTTRLRTLQGEELVVSNAELTTARVQNFKKMDERRIATEFGVTYETDQVKVKRIDSIVQDIITGIDGVRFDRVHFKSFGNSALVFELVYFVTSADYNEYMDIQERFNFALLEAFANENIDFAYPTQTIYHQSVT